MCAVNPSRVGKTFDDAALREIVNTITNDRGCLLEIVNFNVEVRKQFLFLYVVTDMPVRATICVRGGACALLTLTNVLNYLKVQKVDIPKVRVAGLLTDIC